MTEVLRAQNESLQRRFNNLPQFIPYLQETTQLESWHRLLLGTIVVRLRTHFQHLSIAGSAPFDLEYLAWATRNLLELAVWAKYVTTSTENANKLSTDLVIDLAELAKKNLDLLHKHVPAHPKRETLQQQGRWVQEEKDRLGIEENERHLHVGTVAKGIGMGEIFSALNGFLSKLVHPTAFSILLDLDHLTEVQVREWMLFTGHRFAEDGLKDLIAYFDSVGIDSRLLRPEGE